MAKKINEKKQNTRKILADANVEDLAGALNNCTDIATDTKAMQDSLHAMICKIEAGKIKANLTKIKAAYAANIEFMNKLGPALATCQNIEYKPWKEEPCKGPCGWEVDVVYAPDPLCKEKLKFVFNGKLLDLPNASLCSTCVCLKEPKNVKQKKFVTFEGKNIELTSNQYPISFNGSGQLYSFVDNGNVYVGYGYKDKPVEGFAILGTSFATVEDWNKKKVILKSGTSPVTVVVTDSSITIGTDIFNGEACFRGGKELKCPPIPSNFAVGSKANKILQLDEKCVQDFEAAYRLILFEELAQCKSCQSIDMVGSALLRLIKTGLSDKSFNTKLLESFSKNGLYKTFYEHSEFESVGYPILMYMNSIAPPSLKSTSVDIESLGVSTSGGILEPIMFTKDYRAFFESNSLGTTVTPSDQTSFTLNGTTIFVKNSYQESFLTDCSINFYGQKVEYKGVEKVEHKIEESFSLFDQHLFISPTNQAELGINGDVLYYNTILWGMCQQKLMDIQARQATIRNIVNTVALTAAVATYAYSGGASGALYATISRATTYTAGAVAFADFGIQSSKESLTVEELQKSEAFYNGWEVAYNIAMVLDGLANAPMLLTSAAKQTFFVVSKVNNVVENTIKFAARRKAILRLLKMKTTGTLRTGLSVLKWVKVSETGSAIATATKAITKTRLPNDFIDALKVFGKTEDEIVEYFTKYHNDNGFKFLNEVEDLVKQYPNLSRGEAFSLWGYTTDNFYFQLNDWLRRGINSSQTIAMKNILQSALSKVPKYNGIAYRAIKLEGQDLTNFLSKHNVGNIVTYDEFVSCGSTQTAAFLNKPGKNIQLTMEVNNAPVISDFADGIKFRGFDRDELLLLNGRKFIIESSVTEGTIYKIKIKQIN